MDYRNEIKHWMDAVIDATGWSPRAWALRAGTSATNITRFRRDPQGASSPTVSVLAKLAAAVPQDVIIPPPDILTTRESRPPQPQDTGLVPFSDVLADLEDCFILLGDVLHPMEPSDAAKVLTNALREIHRVRIETGEQVDSRGRRLVLHALQPMLRNFDTNQ